MDRSRSSRGSPRPMPPGRTRAMEDSFSATDDNPMYRVAVMLAFAAVPTTVRAEEPAAGAIDFERHVIGLLGKSGCSAGACHGSFQGKGGLRLSLFGFEPEKDFLALTRGG